jgi:hypothetical protein
MKVLTIGGLSSLVQCPKRFLTFGNSWEWKVSIQNRVQRGRWFRQDLALRCFKHYAEWEGHTQNCRAGFW